jgi:hypothetical protein
LADGFVKIYRKIQDHQLWQDRPFSKGHAWIDLLLMANHSDTKFLLGNEVVEAEAGQVITSEHKLMARWGWSKSKVRAFLELIEKDEMITRKTDRKKTTITLCKYRIYNGSQTTKRPQKDREQTASRPQKDPIKNVKNEENIYSSSLVPKEKKIFDHESKAYKCAAYLDRQIRKRLPDRKEMDEAGLQRWADAFDKVNRIDGYEWELIAQVLEFSQKDLFWQTNILSGEKFRKQFITLYARIAHES